VEFAIFAYFYIKNTSLSLYFGQENRICLATRSVLWPKICRKCDSDRGYAPDPAGGAHDAPPDPLVGWGAVTPPHTPPHSAPLAPRCTRLRRLDRRAPWHQILATPLVTFFRQSCASVYGSSCSKEHAKTMLWFEINKLLIAVLKNLLCFFCNFQHTFVPHTEGEMIPQNLWSRYDRGIDFVGLTWHNVRSYTGIPRTHTS